jgi:hypothetical protein
MSTFTRIKTGIPTRNSRYQGNILLFLLTLLLLFAFGAKAQTTISAPTTTPSLPFTICAGSSFPVSFTTTGTFNVSNQFQVQLSNSTGSFLSGTVIIGTGSASPISCLVRISTGAGTQYRIRVLGTSPSTVGSGSNAGTPITVRSKPTSPGTTGGSRCGTGTVAISATGCTTTRWYAASEGGSVLGTGSSFTTPSISATTNYFACCVDGNGCESVRTSATATVNPAATIASYSPTSGIIDQDVITIAGTNLSGITNVSFNGVSATFSDNTATSVSALVPIGATTGPVSLTTPCGVISGSSFTVVKPSIATPTFGQPSGTYDVGFFTTLSTSTAGALIYYTTNGNNPVIGTAFTKLYQDEPIFIASTQTVRALGYRNGWTTSSISTANYTVNNPNIVAKPTISPVTGSYSGGQTVTLSCSTPESVIYFTTNGQVPVPFVNSPVRYRGSFTVYDPQVTIRAIGTRTDWADSDVAVAFYTISGGSQLSACSLNPLPGTYGSPISVTVSNADPLAQIYYTIDGTDPYKLLPLARPYAGPIAINSSRPLKAQAFRNGFGDSPRVVGNYTITGSRKAVDQTIKDEKGAYYTEAVGVYGGNPEQVIQNSPDETSGSGQIEVYPNPTNGTVFVDYGAARENIEISIFNTMGQQVKTASTKESSFGAAMFLGGNPAGFYLVRIKGDNELVAYRKIQLK